MKKLTFVIAVAFFILHDTLAKEKPGATKMQVKGEAKPAPCVNGSASADLDIGNVRARILTDGDMWWDLSNPKYEVPKGSGKHSMYTGALWIGGIDANQQIRVAAQTYRQTGSDFWPGPIDTVSVSTDAVACNTYDNIWKVTRASVISFVQNGTTTPDILSWPGNGNASLNHGHFLAPFHDVNGDGIYDPTLGDYPNYDLQSSGTDCCEVLHGDQTLWWAFNDVGNIHSETGSAQLGLEIHAQAFAYNSGTQAIDDATFYQYKIINRSSITFSNCFLGCWADPDLGNASDDFVGCDVGRGMGYCYNGDADDNGAFGYGVDPPAIGIDILKGPLADAGDGIDNDRNGITDEPGEHIIMSNFMYYENANGVPTGNPSGVTDFYNYLHSTWLDGLHITYGDNGRQSGNPTCNFRFPGDTDSALNATNGFWTESTAGNVPEDRRFLLSAGPFTMLPGEVNCVVTAVPWARPAPGGGPAGSILALKQADDVLQVLFTNCFILAGIESLADNPFLMTAAPIPFREKTIIRFSNARSESFSLMVFDIHGSLVRQITGITGNSVTLDRAGIQSGIYLIRLADSLGRESVLKILAE